MGLSEDAHDRSRDPAPFALLVNELLAPFARQRVEARAPVVLRRAPVGVDEAALLEPLQSRIERPVIDDEHVVGLALDGACDSLTVRGPEDERAKDEQVERPLQVRAVLAVGPLSYRHYTRV